MTDLAALLEVADRAVDQAAELVTTMSLGKVTAKGDRDTVSEIDLAVEEKLRTFLLAETPEIGFLGEEHGASNEAGGALTWSLGPVDSTANLVNGMPLCGVSLGLVEGNRSVLGVIDLPFLGERYRGAAGQGAFRGEERISPRRTTSLKDAIVAIGDYAVGHNAENRNAPRLALTNLLATRAMRVRMLGSAATDLAWVAADRLDASIALSNHLWDTAAGTAIAREAGARVVDWDGTPHTAMSTATVVCAPSIADEVARIVKAAHEEGFELF
ncbi:inositol monophosphatase family protein [Streptomyces smyrnaeus]|uniref:inositol-phosphate phosphatase n=1 Tax=Streptomyces smyrnaeus TaxID=1387713 RepID=A0ABS3XQZ0_9ACTN|nr:inositol monophosphatase family protein [Streptomyces smyrnaeus]MBO8197377.1 inositol monophosphatase family protein [Streptomyces smyrnaeus]